MFVLRRFAVTSLLGLAALGSFAVQAQPVYRIVGPDGRVTFSDRPPPEGAQRSQPGGGFNAAAATGSGSGALPFELRTVANRYPVTLYTGANCAPCGAGRNFLMSRGIPHTERTVTSAEDIEALQRLSSANSLPFLTIGGQQLKGFSEIEWGQFLDAAGYPKTSQLPAGYRNPAPAPLVAAQRPPADAPAAPQQAEAPAAPAPAPAGPAPSNPAGIRF
jgi:glutaredoxin